MYINSLRLNNSLLNDEWVKEEIKGKLFLELNENENTTLEKLWNTLKKKSLEENFFSRQDVIQIGLFLPLQV